MEKQFSFYDSEVSKFSMSGKTYWSEKPDLTLQKLKKKTAKLCDRCKMDDLNLKVIRH
jgi:hypothetical protein